jgi:3,4-dihydroxy 2-butanone 4-phosphate synthase/GTP cyclohydrolase II
LAGLNPSGVICEVINDDGTMSRVDDLVIFGKRHGIKIGTIRDLIAYRRRHDHLVERLCDHSFESRWGGVWNAITYRNRIDGSESLAVLKGSISASSPTLVRVHTLDPLADILGQETGQANSIERAMCAIAEADNGALILLGEGRLAAERGVAAPEGALREYGVGAQILADLGVHDMILLTSHHRVPVGLEAYGLRIVEERPF